MECKVMAASIMKAAQECETAILEHRKTENIKTIEKYTTYKTFFGMRNRTPTQAIDYAKEKGEYPCEDYPIQLSHIRKLYHAANAMDPMSFMNLNNKDLEYIAEFLPAYVLANSK